MKELEPWKKEVDKRGRQVIGEAKEVVDQSKCKEGECTAGNFVTDAMIDSVSNF